MKKLSGKITAAVAAIAIFAGLLCACGTETQQSTGYNRKELYSQAVELEEKSEYSEAAALFKKLEGWMDSTAHYNNCIEQINSAKYAEAEALLEKGDVKGACSIFGKLDYRDSAQITSSILAEHPDYIDKGFVITFGRYEQDNDTENGMEKLEWIVLDVKDGKMLLITKNIIDAKNYNASRSLVTWETCELRSWLNREFIDKAFGNEEKARIVETKVVAHPNPQVLGISPGNDTVDRVFLLSTTEARLYFPSDESRSAKATLYAEARGCFSNQVYEGWWRLRTPGRTEGRYADVNSDGSISFMGLGAYTRCSGTRPAMWVTI